MTAPAAQIEITSAAISRPVIRPPISGLERSVPSMNSGAPWPRAATAKVWVLWWPINRGWVTRTLPGTVIVRPAGTVTIVELRDSDAPRAADADSDNSRSKRPGLVICTLTRWEKTATALCGVSVMLIGSRLSTARVDSATPIVGVPLPPTGVASAATTNGYLAPRVPRSGTSERVILVVSPGSIGPTGSGGGTQRLSRPRTVMRRLAVAGPRWVTNTSKVAEVPAPQLIVLSSSTSGLVSPAAGPTPGPGGVEVMERPPMLSMYWWLRCWWP